MLYYLDGLRHDYRKENEDLRKDVARLSAIVRQYEKRYGKLSRF